jgi:diadenosine tetraphosphate (Ap4A) HIT family hydrolase
MPETPQEFHARAMAAADDEGRLRFGEIPYWEIFPFEVEGLRVKPLDPLTVDEPPRHGEGGVECGACTSADERSSEASEVWRNARWRVSVTEPGGSPLMLMMQPLAHHDLSDLPDDLAGEMGVLLVHLTRAMEALPQVGRVHVAKWGDGGAHLHVFVYARARGMLQLRGMMMAVWDDFLPPVPVEIRDADARSVIQALAASFGGAARGIAA